MDSVMDGESTTSSPPMPSLPQPARKSRVALACTRCKKRKQRCDGGHPLCKSCEKAGTACIYEKTIRPHYPGGKSLYINALEERIAFLEARLPAYAEDHFSVVDASTGAPAEPHVVAVDPNVSCRRVCLNSSSSQQESVSEDVEAEEENHSLVDGVAYLSLRASGTADTHPEPFYLGSSSGATIARMLQTSIFRSSGSRVVGQGLGQRPGSSKRTGSHHHGFASPETTASWIPPVRQQQAQQQVDGDFPFLDQARLLFMTFFDRLHTRWPILDRRRYTELFERQYDEGSLTIMQRSIFHLIYAIAARFLQLTRNPCGVDPETHLLAAIAPMDHILEQHNLGTVQFLLLLALHGQRSPYGAGAWSQVRYAASLCIELGLHRESKRPSAHHDARSLEIRRRAFWSCYGLDRGTSVILGRAFAIDDRDINVALPNAGLEFWDLTHKDPPEESNVGSWSNIEPFIHIIKLERIQSRIHKTVFRVDKDVLSGPPAERAKLDHKMANIRASLDQWLETIPRTPKDAKKITWMYDPESAHHDSQDFFNLQYHKTVLSLFTMLLPTLDPSDPRFITTARSACCVCIAYKRLNQQKTLSYTMISLHSCFVAGLTLMYCLWRSKSLFGYEALEATQACSQSLTIFGEKWSGAVKYRDIFDALSGSLFKTLVTPGGQPSDASSMGFSMMEGMAPSMSPPPRGQQQASQQMMNGGDQMNQGQYGNGGGQSRPSNNSAPAASELVSDAVKEAFMEVDEEAPGGWQGWRMWNEMLGDAPAPAPAPEATQQQDRDRRGDFAGGSSGGSGSSSSTYHANEGWGFVDPLQKSCAQTNGYGSLDGNVLQWDQQNF